MRKIRITLLTSLCCVITACDWLGGGDQKIAPLSPSFVQAVAIPNTVEYNGSTVMHWVTKNAQYVMVNNKKMGAKDSIKFENLTSTFNVTLIAYGEDLLTSIKVVTIPVDNAPAPKIVITFPTEAIPYGSKTSFFWKKEGIVNSVSVDGITQTSDSFTTPALFKSTEYTITVIGPGGTASQKVLISVGDWTTSRFGLLTQDRPLKVKSLEYVTDGGVVGWLTIDKEMAGCSFVLTKENKVIHSDSLGIIKIYDWNFVGDDHIKIFGITALIVSITKDELVFSVETLYYSKPSIFLYSYYRQ